MSNGFKSSGFRFFLFEMRARDLLNGRNMRDEKLPGALNRQGLRGILRVLEAVVGIRSKAVG